MATDTSSGYTYSYKRFTKFCLLFGVDPISCPPSIVVKYIRKMYNAGAAYMTVNHHRSAISKFHQGFDGQTVGSHELVRKAMRSVFRLRPPLPKYKCTFDIVPVLQYISELPANNLLSLKLLTKKTLLSTIYDSLSRVSSISRLGPVVSEHRDHVITHLHHLEKQARPGSVRGFIPIRKFPEDLHLCPAAALLEYCTRVSNL